VIRKSTLFAALFALAALAAAPSSFAACTHPTQLDKLPDGANASIDEMKAANAKVKQYVTDLNTYISCVDQEPPLAQDPSKLSDAQKKEQYDRELVRVQKHNAAVDEQKAMRDKWHDVLEAYKAKHPS
jgi:hypothetical protein